MSGPGTRRSAGYQTTVPGSITRTPTARGPGDTTRDVAASARRTGKSTLPCRARRRRPPHVVHVEVVLLPYVEPAIRDDEVRPAWMRHLGDRERALLAVGRGRRLHQEHDAVLVAEVEPVVRVQDRRRSRARVADVAAPGHLPRHEVD